MSDVARERPAQGPPPSSLQGFPVSRTGPGTALYRAHDHDLGPWWWSSGGPGRFDLEAPRGTCYLATTALVALRERLGPVLSARAVLPASTIERVVVSRLRLPAAARLANVRVAAAAAHGVTREPGVDDPLRRAAGVGRGVRPRRVRRRPLRPAVQPGGGQARSRCSARRGRRRPTPGSWSTRTRCPRWTFPAGRTSCRCPGGAT
ncbi:hypothetical protein GCM10025868_45200 [Angustibacter aerolatus]|uniref:RES domain-containing protein n=1 Tax=Angustibacter aerolatus TaxID=1162965 RepID=A0ABQ6JPT4_9ACTN|nr:hypothetical protein [Angustibacter aerolatus]GMA89270.1 hypothetical protein GCM10025868_45200 [Angustibacter aerolatus]